MTILLLLQYYNIIIIITSTYVAQSVKTRLNILKVK